MSLKPGNTKEIAAYFHCGLWHQREAGQRLATGMDERRGGLDIARPAGLVQTPRLQHRQHRLRTAETSSQHNATITLTDDARPLWETEPTELDFTADGLPCAMRRNHYGIWCGYVGVGPEHPLYGLPVNHPLKLPSSWFEGRRGLEGMGVMDIFMHALEGHKTIEQACPISMALQVHGGCNYAEGHLSERDPDEHYWWFGFDCGHAGDLQSRS